MSFVRSVFSTASNLLPHTSPAQSFVGRMGAMLARHDLLPMAARHLAHLPKSAAQAAPAHSPSRISLEQLRKALTEASPLHPEAKDFADKARLPSALGDREDHMTLTESIHQRIHHAALAVAHWRITRDPLIWLLATGGTISAEGTDHSYKAGARSGEACLEGVTQPPHTRIKVEDVASIDSKDLLASHLFDIRRAVISKLTDASDPAEAVVITHGSDTVHLTALFLQLTIAPELLAKKKIILTASMKPANSATPDGPGNLSDALALARSPHGRGVMVTLNHEIFAPPHFEKKHTTAIDAFAPVNSQRIGTVRNGEVHLETHSPLPPRTFNPGTGPSLPVVSTIYSDPGVDPSHTVGMIQDAVARGAEGVVYVGTGNGTINHVVEEELKRQAQAGKLVVRATKTGNGEVTRNGAFQDDEHSIACAGTLTPDCARLLAQVAIADARHAQGGGAVDMQKIREVFDPYQSPEHRTPPGSLHGRR